MNGAGTRRGYGYGGGPGLAPAQPPAPAAKMYGDGFRRDMVSGFEQEKPRINIVNQKPPQSSAHVDLKDPIQIHLLTETALSDSREFQVLSPEEVDDLKKQIQSLTQRVQQTKANLTIQSKYRDAAISMAKLYSSSVPKRRSLLGNRASGGDSAQEAEMERQASEKRCEELSAELVSLEKRLVDFQRRLLQHTAGILTLTHRGSSKKQSQSRGAQLLPNGMPGSPESLYTYSTNRDSLDAVDDDGYYDDGNLYLGLDQRDGQAGKPRRKPFEIPPKSPVRERNNQLRDEADRLRETAAETEKRLGELNDKLRDLVVAFNPSRNGGFAKPPSGNASGARNGAQAAEMVNIQLEYLENGLAAAFDEQRILGAEAFQNTERAEAAAITLGQTERRIESLNRQVLDVLQSSQPDYPLPPDMLAAELDEQLDYLQNSLRALQTELARAAEQSSTKSADRQNLEQTETVLTGLWEIIQTGYAGIQRKKAERRKTRIEMGLEEDEEDMSGDDDMNTNEPYTLQAFSTKVQWLYAQSTSLKDQKGVLKRQIQQQRDLNNKSDSAKDLEIKQKSDQLRRAEDLLDSTEREAQTAQEKLLRALEDLENLQQSSAAEQAASAQASQDQLMERDAAVSSLEANNSQLKQKLSVVEAGAAAIQAQLAQATESKKAAELSAEKLLKDLKDKDDELERMNGMVAELKTEVTIAKAELEGAYGSRSQRAAEAAALSKKTGDSGEVAKLRAELASTLKEFEDMTKETIAAEKEKLDLESRLDEALAARTRAESEAARLQEQLDAEKLKAPTGTAATKPGATMLSEQFRATMKEERKKFQDDLRDEQAKRRKLEDELRALKRAQGPGKSPLGPLSPLSPR